MAAERAGEKTQNARGADRHNEKATTEDDEDEHDKTQIRRAARRGGQTFAFHPGGAL